MVEKQVENVTKEIDSKIQLSKEEEDPFENVKKELYKLLEVQDKV